MSHALPRTRFWEIPVYLDQADYHHSHQVVRCVDYGVPQTRSRLVLLASRLATSRCCLPLTPMVTITVRDTIQDLDSIEAGDASKFDPLHKSRRTVAKEPAPHPQFQSLEEPGATGRNAAGGMSHTRKWTYISGSMVGCNGIDRLPRYHAFTDLAVDDLDIRNKTAPFPCERERSCKHFLRLFFRSDGDRIYITSVARPDWKCGPGEAW